MSKFVMSPKQVMDEVLDEVELNDHAIDALNDLLKRKVIEIKRNGHFRNFEIYEKDITGKYSLKVYYNYLKDADWDVTYVSSQRDGTFISVKVP